VERVAFIVDATGEGGSTVCSIRRRWRSSGWPGFPPTGHRRRAASGDRPSRTNPVLFTGGGPYRAGARTLVFDVDLVESKSAPEDVPGADRSACGGLAEKLHSWKVPAPRGRPLVRLVWGKAWNLPGRHSPRSPSGSTRFGDTGAPPRRSVGCASGLLRVAEPARRVGAPPSTTSLFRLGPGSRPSTSGPGRGAGRWRGRGRTRVRAAYASTCLRRPTLGQCAALAAARRPQRGSANPMEVAAGAVLVGTPEPAVRREPASRWQAVEVTALDGGPVAGATVRILSVRVSCRFAARRASASSACTTRAGYQSWPAPSGLGARLAVRNRRRRRAAVRRRRHRRRAGPGGRTATTTARIPRLRPAATGCASGSR